MGKEDIIKKISKYIIIPDNGEYYLIAKLKTIDPNGLRETIDINTILISKHLVNKIKPSHTNPVVNKNANLIEITHSQEQPEYKNTIQAVAIIERDMKIYVIDDGQYTTMLFAEEY